MDAYDAASQAAYEIVQSCINSIKSRIESGEVTEDDLSDAIHEEVDNALIYTRDQYVCVFGLRDDEDCIEEGLCTPENFGQALASQAFCNLRSVVGSHDFSDALAVASDKRAETEGDAPPCEKCAHLCNGDCEKCGSAPMVPGDKLCADCDATERDSETEGA